MNGEDFEAFLELASEELEEDFAEQMYGHNAHESVELMDEMAMYRVRFLISGVISGYNKAIENSDFFEAVVFHSLLKDLLELDEEIAKQYAESQQHQNPFSAIFGQT